MMSMHRISRDEQLVASLPTPNSGYSQAWRQDRKATANLHSGNVLPGFTPKH